LKWNRNRHDYKINPRLRLLRYDAVDEDIFLPHYDATTTMNDDDDGRDYQSKLTILVYLNTDFEGGETLFLNSLVRSNATTVQGGNVLKITPQVGQMVVFNHELYHASRELLYNKDIVVPKRPNTKMMITPDADDGIMGGSKFVLRSDVMFEIKTNSNDMDKQEESRNSSSRMTPDDIMTTMTSRLELAGNNDVTSSSMVVDPKVVDIVNSMVNDDRQQQQYSDDSHNQLTSILAQLDLLQSPVRTLLVPGRQKLLTMLLDLGANPVYCETFLNKCVECLE
jgi:hypothetical protein